MEYLFSLNLTGNNIDSDHQQKASSSLTSIIKKKSLDSGPPEKQTNVANQRLAPKESLKKNTKLNRYSNLNKLKSLSNIRDPRERTRIANKKLNEITESAERLQSCLNDATAYDDNIVRKLRHMKRISIKKKYKEHLSNNKTEYSHINLPSANKPKIGPSTLDIQVSLNKLKMNPNELNDRNSLMSIISFCFDENISNISNSLNDRTIQKRKQVSFNFN